MFSTSLVYHAFAHRYNADMPISLNLKDNEDEYKGVKEVREVARGIVLDDKGNVAIHTVSRDDIFCKQTYYETPGGGVDKGETYEQALLRECDEELGYEVEILAYVGEVNDYYNLIGTTMAYVTHGGSFGGIEPNSYSGDVVVPEQISYKGNTYRVYTIGNNAFACCDELTSVRLPSTVHGIGFCAFLGSDKLRQVFLPDDFRVVNSCAFTGCTSLQQFSIPRKAELVDSLTFYCCASLTSMVLPHRIRTICQGALEHLPSIRHLYHLWG